jgi:hypothetical protein
MSNKIGENQVEPMMSMIPITLHPVLKFYQPRNRPNSLFYLEGRN